MFTIQKLLDGYRNRDFSPVEIANMYIERAKKTNEMNAFITITEERAIIQAKAAEQRWACGEEGNLEGIPLSYKDNIYVKGIPATSGSQIDRHFIPDEDAETVRLLSQAGAVMIGKTNMHEFAFGITNHNPFYGPAKNPWNPSLIAGGSSGGSAVSVLLDSSIASMGTDTGGSVRIPAACCGLIGLKPTYGFIDHKGVTLISWNLDHIGPIARNVEDLSIILEALTNKHYTLNESELDIHGWKIGVPVDFFTERIEPEILDGYKDALQKLEDAGAVLVDVKVPYIEEAESLTFTIAVSEAGHVHKERIRMHINEYGKDVRQVMKTAKNIPAVDYIHALERKREITESFNQVFEEVDLIVTPTLPALPKEIGKEMVSIHGEAEPIFNCMIRYTSYFNLTGHPALAIPGVFAKEKFPFGIQLVGPYFMEKRLLKAAGTFEKHYLTGFYKERDQRFGNPDVFLR
jgi:aspartyl-tRNA(Asn)/glutamyl-tRNA(Gln) amidotransferase subunit A